MRQLKQEIEWAEVGNMTEEVQKLKVELEYYKEANRALIETKRLLVEGLEQAKQLNRDLYADTVISDRKINAINEIMNQHNIDLEKDNVKIHFLYEQAQAELEKAMETANTYALKVVKVNEILDEPDWTLGDLKLRKRLCEVLQQSIVVGKVSEHGDEK